MIIIFIIGMLLYIVSPLPVQLIALVINIMLPDRIPFIDEFIMCCSSIGKIRNLGNGLMFLEDHPVVAKILTIIIVAGLALWAFIFIKTGIEAMFF